MLGSTASIEDLIRDFLSGSGVPCPAHFEEAKAQFDRIVELSDVSKPHFRARIFTWAVTGSPFVSPDEQKINVGVSDFSESRLVSNLHFRSLFLTMAT